MMNKPKVLALAPYCDGTDVGEAHCAYMWIKELSKRADVTLLSLQRAGRKPVQDQLADVKVLTRPEPGWTGRFERLNAMAKLSYFSFYRWAVREIRSQLKGGVHYDVAHQFSPIALRFPSPLRKFSIPYVLGPLGGSLSTPGAFQAECGSASWYTHFRQFDRVRLGIDPFLKSTYRRASAVLGVAPYVAELIGENRPHCFDVMSELGVERLNSMDQKRFSSGRFRMLHVGRGVRTKGLRDCIRALNLLRDVPGIHLDVAGKGEEMAICETLAKELDLSHLVTFHGQVSRAEVDRLYAAADVFCFPSFREPSGSVVFEALSFGLPVIVADRGGPGHVVDDSCGFKIAVTEPKLFAQQIASAARTLAAMPELRRRLSIGAIEKMTEIGLWPAKIERLLSLYQQITDSTLHSKETSSSCPVQQSQPESLLSHQVVATGSKC